MPLLAMLPPTAPVAPGGGEAPGGDRERQSPVRDVHCHRPGTLGPGARDGEISTGVHEARAERGEQPCAAIGSVALDDAAEVEPHARAELDAAAPHGHVPGGARVWRGASGGVLVELVEGAVIARGDEGVVERWVEAPGGVVTGGQRELDDGAQVGTGLDRPGLVEA